MGREIRRVPPGWEHPRKPDGSYRPLMDGSFAEADAEWLEGAEKWTAGLRHDYARGGWKPREPDEIGTWEGWAGRRPQAEEYMPAWSPEEATWYRMYETCSEGTPISPAFASPEEVARWCADNGASALGSMTASYEAWLRVARGGYAPSAVYKPGRGLQSGVEAAGEKPQ